MQTPCIKCGKKIEKDHPNRRYCNVCKAVVLKLHQNRKYQKNPWYKPNSKKGTCMICKREFYGLQNNRKFCSQKCRAENRKLIRYQKSMGELAIKIEKLKKQHHSN